MSLQISFTINNSCDCTTLTFTEKTGVYSTANIGGYGAPNPVVGDVDTALLTIEDLTDNLEYDDITITPSSVFGETTINASDLEILSVNAGLTKFTDGQYKFTYTVVIDNIIYTYVQYKLFLCNALCKLKSKLGEIITDCYECNSPSKEKLIEAWAIYNALKNYKYCSDTSGINKSLDVLNVLLEDLKCKNC